MLRVTSICLAMSASPALADLSMIFVEGAPKDRFELRNTGTCPIGALQVALDLTGSAGALIFDTSDRGAGVQVYQPFELVQGADALVQSPVVGDGDKVILLDIQSLAPDQVIAFTIDVDDTLSSRQITVTDSEIEGAQVSASGRSARFGADARARLTMPACIG